MEAYSCQGDTLLLLHGTHHTYMSTLFKLTNKIARFVQDLERKNKNLDSKFSKGTVSEHTLWVEVQKGIPPYVEESIALLEIGSHKLKQLKDEVESILMTSGYCDPADLSPYLEKDNQDQLIMLKLILKLLYLSGRSHCSDSKVIETEAPRNDMTTVLENSRHTTQSKTASHA